MLKMAKFVPRTQFGGILAKNVRYCSKKDAPIEPPIEPLQMSYNSYENLSSDPNTPPVIIMHGLLKFHSNSLRSIESFIRIIIYDTFPGLFGSKQNWRSISKAIHTKTNPTRKVIAVDARNHGESPHSARHRYVDLAEDVHLFCKEHKISKAVIIGHSMGGRAMMVFALKYVNSPRID